MQLFLLQIMNCLFQITEEDVKERIIGITGDGAFAKSNKPFKSTINDLFGKEIQIRWDLLHLINCAHKEVRGKTKDESKEATTSVEVEEEPEAFDADPVHDDILSEPESTQSDGEESDDEDIIVVDEVRLLIDFVQSTAKKFRTGILFTGLKMSTGFKFKRPRCWSATRMVVYEFDMIESFLTNRYYVDIPNQYLVLAQTQCLVMLTLKMILKHCQMCEIPHSYIQRVIVGKVGKQAMKLASQVAVDMVNKKSIEYLQVHDESTNVIMSQDKKCFSQQLKKYVEAKREFWATTEEPRERVTRGNTALKMTVEEAKVISDRYTDNLWRATKKRIAYTDLSESPCSFSEAPAEGVFSVYERVSTGRPSMTHDHLVALTRVSAHGPPAATEAAKELASNALKKYKSKFGERFCTRNWYNGKVSKTINDVKRRKWDW